MSNGGSNEEKDAPIKRELNTAREPVAEQELKAAQAQEAAEEQSARQLKATQEREAVQTLKTQLLAELKSQSRLKRQLLEELDAKPASRISSFFQHQAVLLVIGFALTGLLGAWLTQSWQSNEWSRQQVALQEQKLLDRKTSLSDDVTDAVSETLAAADDILALRAFKAGPTERQRQITTRIDFWQETSRRWRVKSKVLKQRLQTYYTDNAIHAAFDEIILERRQIGNAISRLISEITSESKWPPTEPVNDKAVGEQVNKTIDKLLELTKLMLKEAS